MSGSTTGTCYYIGCPNKSLVHDQGQGQPSGPGEKAAPLLYFALPKDQTMRQLWYEVIGNSDLSKFISKKVLRAQGHVCSLHFVDSDYTDSKKDTLKDDAIPVSYDKFGPGVNSGKTLVRHQPQAQGLMEHTPGPGRTKVDIEEMPPSESAKPTRRHAHENRKDGTFKSMKCLSVRQVMKGVKTEDQFDMLCTQIESLQMLNQRDVGDWYFVRYGRKMGTCASLKRLVLKELDYNVYSYPFPLFRRMLQINENFECQVTVDGRDVTAKYCPEIPLILNTSQRAHQLLSIVFQTKLCDGLSLWNCSSPESKGLGSNELGTLAENRCDNHWYAKKCELIVMNGETSCVNCITLHKMFDQERERREKEEEDRIGSKSQDQGLSQAEVNYNDRVSVWLNQYNLPVSIGVGASTGDQAELQYPSVPDPGAVTQVEANLESGRDREIGTDPHLTTTAPGPDNLGKTDPLARDPLKPKRPAQSIDDSDYEEYFSSSSGESIEQVDTLVEGKKKDPVETITGDLESQTETDEDTDTETETILPD